MLIHHGGNLTKICSTYGIEPEDIIDFSANINPFGFPVELYEELASNMKSLLHYPDPDCTKLKNMLAEKYLCSSENILIGNGSTELFYLICRTVSADRGLVFLPTFTEYARALRCAGSEVEEIICDERDMFRVDPLIGKYCELQSEQDVPPNEINMSSNIVFLCNPNNPTGNLIKKDDILRLTSILTNTLVVIDEAFMEFVIRPERYSLIAHAANMKNLVVVRSLTKFFGFPGIRLGFMVGHSDIIKRLLTQKEPWTVNSFALTAGEHSIKNDEFIINSRDYINKEKIFLYEELAEIDGIWPFEPSVNFILIKITNENFKASTVYDELIKYGIVVRNCLNFASLSEKFLRVAVRTRDENIKLIYALREVFQKPA